MSPIFKTIWSIPFCICTVYPMLAMIRWLGCSPNSERDVRMRKHLLLSSSLFLGMMVFIGLLDV